MECFAWVTQGERLRIAREKDFAAVSGSRCEVLSTHPHYQGKHEESTKNVGYLRPRDEKAAAEPLEIF